MHGDGAETLHHMKQEGWVVPGEKRAKSSVGYLHIRAAGLSTGHVRNWGYSRRGSKISQQQATLSLAGWWGGAAVAGVGLESAAARSKASAPVTSACVPPPSPRESP